MHASDNSQATILCMHARSAAAAHNENLKSRKTRARLAGDDKTQRRAKAHAHPASASPSLVSPQPRPAAAAAHRRRHLPRPPRTDGGTCRGRRAPTATPRRAALTLSLYQRFCWIFGSFLVFQSFQLAIQILMPHAPLSRRWPNSCGGSCAYLSVEHTLNRHWLLGPKMMMIVK